MEVYEVSQRDVNYTGNLAQPLRGRALVIANDSEELLGIIATIFGDDFNLGGLYGHEVPVHLFEEDFTNREIREVMADYYRPYDLSEQSLDRYGNSNCMMLHVN